MSKLKFTKLFLPLAITVILVAAVVAWNQAYQEPDAANLVVNGNRLSAEIADQPMEWSRGLSNRDRLAEDQAMLFIFDNLDFHGIWMKDMRFSIDIIWLDDDKRVIHLVESAQPGSYPTVFKPDQLARYVIETNAGYVQAHGLALGQTVQF